MPHVHMWFQNHIEFSLYLTAVYPSKAPAGHAKTMVPILLGICSEELQSEIYHETTAVDFSDDYISEAGHDRKLLLSLAHLFFLVEDIHWVEKTCQVNIFQIQMALLPPKQVMLDYYEALAMC